ncbi:MAG: ParB/RepB/Spo0J family partition protein [Myxococcota bacterium]
MPTRRNSLGKGLGALIAPPKYSNLSDEYFLCPIAQVRPDPEQPRQRFDDDALAELIGSIKEKGILQPLVVRKDDQGYVVVAGERRLRAAAQAGLEEVPVLVKDVATEEAFELALIENIQREDLNPVEEAQAYQRLLDRPGMTQDGLARRIGKNRSTVANALRLLRLEAPVQELVVDGKLSAGHARAVLSVDQPDERTDLARTIVDRGLTVREAESAARKLKEPDTTPKRSKRSTHPLQPYCDGVAEELAEALGTRVTVKSRGRKGRVILEFKGVDDLRRLRDRLVAAAVED